VFVKNALLDEECEIEITDVSKKFAYATVKEQLAVSKSRQEVSCACYGHCGGCSFLHTTIENENEIKENYVKSIFRKNKIDIEVAKIEAPSVEKYRNKVVFHFENGEYGYMASGTNKLVPHSGCKLNDDIFDKIAALTGKCLPKKSLRALYIRKNSQQNGEVMVCPILRETVDLTSYVGKLILEFPNVKTVLYSVYNERDFALENVKFKTLYGDGYIYDELLGLKFRISPSSFYQVNHECAEKLYEKAIKLAALRPTDKCADLFCGTGTIGIIAASKTGASVYGVEINEEAVKDAKYNAKLNGVKNISFEATDAKNFGEAVDVAIIDPPRKGCSTFMIETLLRLKPKRIVYVSCNADTLSRDVKSLLGEYEISSPLYPFNMFPKTSHVESVVCLRRQSDGNAVHIAQL
jgi:23S rRNA (uracil1939-C5)-methyltransferase